MDIAQLHRTALDNLRGTLAGVSDGQWTAPTPNSDWDVRALVHHVVYGNLWAAELAAGKTIAEVGDRLEGDVLGSDPLAAYDASAQAAADAFDAPGALDAPCAVSYGPVPGSVYAGHRFLDVLLHQWDLAVATGQDTTLAPALVDACVEVLTPQAEAFRAAGAFGPAVDVPDDADAQTRLLALTGRGA
jgi:uncharacterized protein (TIGR03086 family)